MSTHKSTPRRLARPALTIALAAASIVAAVSGVAAVQSQRTDEALPIVAVRAERPAGFADLVAQVKPAVVNIAAERTQQAARLELPGNGDGELERHLRRFFERSLPNGEQRPEGRAQGQGSGFVIDPDGFVVTNYHVVENAEKITVTLDDGRRLQAELRGHDPKTDLAVLKVDSDQALPFLRFGDSDGVRAGDWVVAIGNPFGLGGTVTTGIVSARGRDIHAGPYDDFLQIDAPINRGNSGGPLFDLDGRVIGVNTAIFSPNGGNVGIGFAIPARMAQPIIAQLKSDGHVQRAWLGVQIQPMNDDIAASLGLDSVAGALVAQVLPGTPAAAAGLQPGDVVLSLDGQQVARLKDLPRLVAATPAGKRVELGVWRAGERIAVSAVLAASDDGEPVTAATTPDSEQRLGLALAPLDQAAREHFSIDPDVRGAVVVKVAPDSAAARQGLRPGDVVLRAGQQAISGPQDVLSAVGEAREAQRDSVLLLVRRGDNQRFVSVPLGRA